MSGKKNGVIYLTIYDAGNNTDMKDSVGTEYTLQDLNEMAAKKSQNDSPQGKYY